MVNDDKIPVLKLMVIIVDRNRANQASEVLQDQFVRFQFVCSGEGTANSELLSVMGLGSSEKSILLCLQPDYRVQGLMRTVSERLQLSQRGKGIAFTIPLSGVSNPMTQLLTTEKLEKITAHLEPEKKEHIFNLFDQHMKRSWEYVETEKSQYDLIISVINRGYSDELMDKAKEAGATGGTIIQTRRIGIEDTVKFFGISVQSEKEIVAILTVHPYKNAIMKAINQYCGLNSDARGIVFSLPVDSVAGPSFMDSIG